MKRIPAHAKPEPPLARSLQRAEILDVIGEDTVSVRGLSAPTAEVLRAEIAVLGYVPVIGDRVLVERVDDGCFVLGVLGSARRRGLIAAVSTESGVELRVPEGDLTLSAAGRVVIRATEVETTAEVVRTSAAEVVSAVGRLEIEATRVVERAGDVYRHVEGLSELQTGRARTLVEGECQVQAKRTTIQSDEDTIIDGKRVLLG